MGSRVMWVLLAGAALVTGMVVQDGGHIFSWTHDTDRSAKIEAEVSRAVDSAWDDSDVVTIDGREYPVTEAQKDAMARAIGQLVKTEANLAAVKISGSDDEVKAATDDRDKARTQMEQIKAEMIAQKEAARSSRDDARKQIRDDVRESIREAVRN